MTTSMSPNAAIVSAKSPRGGSPGMLTWGASQQVCAGVLMRLWCRCLGPGRSLGLVLGGSRLGGRFAGGGAARWLPGWVGSVGEAGYRAERGERGCGEQDVVEAAGGAGAGGVGDRGAGGGRDCGGYRGAGAGGDGGGQPAGGAGRGGQARQGAQGCG